MQPSNSISKISNILGHHALSNLLIPHQRNIIPDMDCIPGRNMVDDRIEEYFAESFAGLTTGIKEILEWALNFICPSCPAIGIVVDDTFAVDVLELSDMAVNTGRRNLGHNIAIVDETIGIDVEVFLETLVAHAG